MLWKCLEKTCDESAFLSTEPYAIIRLSKGRRVYLDNRSKTLFQEVIKNPNITNKQLEVKYKLSRYQISYSFQKVNEWLKWKNYPEVKRSKNGRFILEPELTALFSEKETQIRA